MAFIFFRKWIDQWRNQKDTQNTEQNNDFAKKLQKRSFSPLTYQNPYMIYMHKIIEQIIKQKKIPYKKLELIIIDAEEDQIQDEDDIQKFLYQFENQLNYLLILTNKPERYELFIDEMYEENGLIVQQLAKSASKQARGNLILDFERRSNILEGNNNCSKAIYLPVYKRPWEISENLDILVPVGYNTLIVDGIFPIDSEESQLMNERDRLDWEFRKG